MLFIETFFFLIPFPFFPFAIWNDYPYDYGAGSIITCVIGVIVFFLVIAMNLLCCAQVKKHTSVFALQEPNGQQYQQPLIQ